MNFVLTNIVTPALTFAKVEKGQVFLCWDSYYFKVSEDNAVRIGVTDDYILDDDEPIWHEASFDSNTVVKEVYPNVSITFN